MLNKPLPELFSDAEAEAFVETADLTVYDLSGFVEARFEMRPVDKSITLRLPASLLDAVHKEAARLGLPLQSFIRLALEQALARK
jgi:predicted DNA binding CopG/RHH family protein